MREKKYDPRTIFYTTVIYIIIIGFIKRYYEIILIMPFLLLQLKLFSIDIHKLIKVLKYSIGLFLSIIFINFIFMGKDIFFILLSIFKILSIIFLTTSMVSKMEIREIGFVIEKTLSPLKILKLPTESIGVITALSFKFIPVLEEEVKRILLAQKSRGIDYKLMSKKEKLKNIPTLFFPVIISGIQNAVNLAIAMEVRGYGNGIRRTRLKDYTFKKDDYIYTLSTIFIAILFFSFPYVFRIS